MGLVSVTLSPCAAVMATRMGATAIPLAASARASDNGYQSSDRGCGLRQGVICCCIRGECDSISHFGVGHPLINALTHTVAYACCLHGLHL